jgi:hypothetical protein
VFFGGLASFLALAWLPRPLGAPIDVRIEFDAPSDCAEVSSFYDRVRARTDRVRLAEAGVEALTLRVRVVRKGASVHGQLRMTDEQGASTTREVDGASCIEVVDALSLTATLALDPTASPEAPPATIPPPVEVVTLVATPSRPPPPGREGSLGFEAGAQLGVAEVISPYLSADGALFVRLTSGLGERVSRSLGLTLAHFGNDIVQSSQDVSARLTTLSLSACPARFDAGGAFSLEPCALFAGGLLSVSSRGVSNPGSALRSWWSAGALVRAALPVGGGVALEVEAGGAIPLLKRRFILSTVPERFLGESPGISGFASLGASYRF